METNDTQQNQQPPQQVTGGKRSFMDRQFGDMSGCGQWFIVILFPFIGLTLGVIGLLACKDTNARARAGNMALVGGIWFVISMFLFIGMINSAPK